MTDAAWTIASRREVNIANARRNIVNWERQLAELTSLIPYDEAARDLLNQCKIASGIEWRQHEDAEAGVQAEDAQAMEVEGTAANRR